MRFKVECYDIAPDYLDDYGATRDVRYWTKPTKVQALKTVDQSIKDQVKQLVDSLTPEFRRFYETLTEADFRAIATADERDTYFDVSLGLPDFRVEKIPHTPGIFKLKRGDETIFEGHFSTMMAYAVQHMRGLLPMLVQFARRNEQTILPRFSDPMQALSRFRRDREHMPGLERISKTEEIDTDAAQTFFKFYQPGNFESILHFGSGPWMSGSFLACLMMSENSFFVDPLYKGRYGYTKTIAEYMKEPFDANYDLIVSDVAYGQDGGLANNNELINTILDYSVAKSSQYVVKVHFALQTQRRFLRYDKPRPHNAEIVLHGRKNLGQPFVKMKAELGQMITKANERRNRQILTHTFDDVIKKTVVSPGLLARLASLMYMKSEQGKWSRKNPRAYLNNTTCRITPKKKRTRTQALLGIGRVNDYRKFYDDYLRITRSSRPPWEYTDEYFHIPYNIPLQGDMFNIQIDYIHDPYILANSVCRNARLRGIKMFYNMGRWVLLN